MPPADLRPPTSSADAPVAMNLQAILLGSGASRAVIDGRTVRVNDQHGDARVVAIYPHAVLIERQGQRALLRLADPVMKPSR
ncbi:MAG TPA: Type II secretory pathway component [Pseudomonas sp.]|nr:Type II secretory pathway component [Pseudomonas sp.]